MSAKRKGHLVTAKRWEQSVPVQLRIEATADDNEPSEILTKNATLPFMPRHRDELAVGPDGDYIRVDTVYWCPDDGLSVWFDDSDGKGQLDRFVQDGWRIEP